MQQAQIKLQKRVLAEALKQERELFSKMSLVKGVTEIRFAQFVLAALDVELEKLSNDKKHDTLEKICPMNLYPKKQIYLPHLSTPKKGKVTLIYFENFGKELNLKPVTGFETTTFGAAVH